MAILGAIGSVVTANSGALGSLLGGSDPKKDEERKARARSYFEQARAGSGDAEARLRCMAGEMTERAVSMGILDERGSCDLAGGSSVGRAYAKQLVAELDIIRAGQDIKQTIGTGLVKAGAAAAGTGANMLGVQGSIKAVADSVPVWVWVGLAVVAGFAVVKVLR